MPAEERVQEPDVVVVAAGQGPVVDVPAARTVVAADGGADRALELGLAVDVVIGDLDSIGPETLVGLERDGVRVLGHPTAKDATDLELALDEALELGAVRVLVVASAAGRLDHLLSSLLLLGHERYARLELTALVGDAAAWIVRGERRLEGRPGALLSLFALGGPARIRTEGLEYPLVDEVVEPGSSRGVSNVFLDDAATVRVTEGVVLALRPGGTA
jgi:thiamine pyrophosphokinase